MSETEHKDAERCGRELRRLMAERGGWMLKWDQLTDLEREGWREYAMRFASFVREGPGAVTAPPWQPIETAPVPPARGEATAGANGPDVLVFDPVHGPVAAHACWVSWQAEMFWSETTVGEASLNPTHWMPIPEGP